MGNEAKKNSENTLNKGADKEISKDRNIDRRLESEAGQMREAWQIEDTSDPEVSVPAIRHVGPTLESDPEYLEMAGYGGPTPEAQIAEGTASIPDLSEVTGEGLDPVSGQTMNANRPEPLKTRLPGDTSSDPHTDLGQDNATSVQHRGAGKNRAA